MGRGGGSWGGWVGSGRSPEGGWVGVVGVQGVGG